MDMDMDLNVDVQNIVKVKMKEEEAEGSSEIFEHSYILQPAVIIKEAEGRSSEMICEHSDLVQPAVIIKEEAKGSSEIFEHSDLLQPAVIIKKEAEGEGSSEMIFEHSDLLQPAVIIKEENVEYDLNEDNNTQQECLVCLNSSTNVSWWTKIGTGNPSCLDKHLSSIFLLTKVLQMTRSECVSILRKSFGVNPGHWCVLCENCSNLFREAVNIHQMILQLEEKLGGVRKEMIRKIDESSNVDDLFGGRNTDGGIMDMHNLIRCQVRAQGQQTPINEEHVEVIHWSNDIYDEVSPESVNSATDHEGIDLDAEESNYLKSDYKRRDSTWRQYSDTVSAKRVQKLVSHHKKKNFKMKCNSCRFSSYYKKSLDEHLKHHKIYTATTCNICKYPFKCEDILQNHLRRFHDQNRHKCSTCMKKLPSSEQLVRHEEQHKMNDNVVILEDKGKFQCKLCPEGDKIFNGRIPVFAHMKNNHVEELNLRLYYCPSCSYRSYTKGGVEQHMDRSHKNLRRLGNDNDNPIKWTDIEDKQKNAVICDNCGRSFTEKEELQQHVQKVHSVEKKKPVRKKIIRQNNKCKHCDVDGAQVENFIHHRKTCHPELYKYNCDQCDGVFINETLLEYHKRFKHPEEKRSKRIAKMDLIGRKSLR